MTRPARQPGVVESDTRRRGVVVVYASIFMLVLFAFVSLAVDWGRAQTAKTEMQDAVDAAARYAAAGLFDNTYVAKAQAAGLQNKVDGTTLSVAAADVTVGNWSTSSRTFTAGGTPTNAVRVTGRRTQANGNPVPLTFGRVIGVNSVDVKATSIARQSSLAAVGIDSLTLSGNGTVQRKSGEAGGVMVASNGSYGTATNTTIAGDVLYRTPPSLTGTVSGRLVQLASDFAYASASVPGGTYDYGTLNVTSGNNGVAGNVYASGDVVIGGNAVVTLYGNTNVYVGGNLTVTGDCNVTTNGYRIYFYSTGTGNVTLSNNLALPLIVYSPRSAVTVSGTGAITGSVVGKTVSISGTLNFNGVSAIPFKPTGGGDPMAAGGVITMK